MKCFSTRISGGLRAGLLAALAIGATFAGAAHANPNQLYLAPAAVRVVAEPYDDASLVGLIPARQKVCLVKQEKNWCEVRGYHSGWVKCSHITRVVPGKPC